jgi:hypothetical protein
MTTTITIKSHTVQLNGNLLTGDTYPIKQWIKEYLNGKWDAERKGWVVDLHQVETWTGTCIQIATTEQTVQAESRKTDMQRGIWQRNGELTEDY